MHPRDQSIFALSSGRPPSAIAMVRLSGPQARTVLTALAGRIPAPRMATRVLLRDASGLPIDDAVVLWFPGPASATGEDVAEFHVHGGRAVLAALFGALSAFGDVRAAGKLAGLRGSHILKARERGKQGCQYRASAMNVKLGDILAGRAGRSGEPQHHRIVDSPPVSIAN